MSLSPVVFQPRPMLQVIMQALDIASDDVWIYIFGFLFIPDILACRQTCKRLMTLSKLKSVWITACEVHVIHEGFPFLCVSPGSIEMPELERRTCRALRLGNQYRSPSCALRGSVTWRANSSNAISDVFFLPGHGDQWLLTASKGIWYQISCWNLSPRLSRGKEPRRACDWSPKGGVFKGLAVNKDPHDCVQLAVGITQKDETRIDLLSLFHGDAEPQFRVVKSLECGLCPMTLQGGLLAASDDHMRTKIIDYNTGSEAVLQSSTEVSALHLEYNRCFQVVFANQYIFVVRARSIEQYPWPELLSQQEGTYVYVPIACHSFGWLDSIAISPTARPSQSLSMIFRCKNNDPWSQDRPTLDFYTLPAAGCPDNDDVDNASKPYTFPPSLSVQIPLVRGFLRCTDLILRPHGTAVWISPHQSHSTGLVQMDIQAENPFQQPVAEFHTDPGGECLMLGMFKGTATPHDMARPLYRNSHNNWTSMDYSEELGRVALGRADGLVTLLEL